MNTDTAATNSAAWLRKCAAFLTARGAPDSEATAAELAELFGTNGDPTQCAYEHMQMLREEAEAQP